MKIKHAVLSFAVLAMAGCILLLSNHSAALSSSETDNLYLVKRIYVSEEKEYVIPEQDAPKEKRLISYLKEELKNIGFVVVDEPSSADAILKGEFGWMAVLHGPQPDPPEYVYNYQVLTSNKVRLWHGKFTLRSRLNEAEVDRRAAQKIANKLLNAWLKSAKNAGLNVAGRVQ